jgi:YtoQ family protein
MSERTWTVYLSGEIHTSWRDELRAAAEEFSLPVRFTGPVLDHATSDECAVRILGEQEQLFWRDNVGAKLNGIRNRTLLPEADVVVVRFGDKYRQWNAAFDAGWAAAIGKPLIVMHAPELGHGLKEIDAAAGAVAQTPEQVAQLLRYCIEGKA